MWARGQGSIAISGSKPISALRYVAVWRILDMLRVQLSADRAEETVNAILNDSAKYGLADGWWSEAAL
jgi:hypothetical protein